MRYVARYHTQYRRWFVFDLVNQAWGTYGYAEKHTANKRADKLNGAIFAAKAKIKSDFGMVHAGDEPPPRAYKED